jgi:hypothetical protein
MSPDDEWAILSPRIQRVLTAETSATLTNRTVMAGGGGRGGRGGAAAGGTTVTANTNAVATALNELLLALQDPATPDAVIKTKLEVLRVAKTKADDDLKAARRDLQDYVTLRQEAILVTQGYLD